MLLTLGICTMQPHVTQIFLIVLRSSLLLHEQNQHKRRALGDSVRLQLSIMLLMAIYYLQSFCSIAQ